MTEQALGKHNGVTAYPDFIVVKDVVVPARGTLHVPVATEFMGRRNRDSAVISTFNSRSRVALSGGEVPDDAIHTVPHIVDGSERPPYAQIRLHNHAAGKLRVPAGEGVGYRVDYDPNALLRGAELVRRVDEGLIIPGEKWRWLTLEGNPKVVDDRVGIIVEFDPTEGRTRYQDASIPQGPTSGFRGNLDRVLEQVDDERPTGYVVYPSMGDIVFTDTVGFIPPPDLLPTNEPLANEDHANSRHLHTSRKWPIFFEIKRPDSPIEIKRPDLPSNEIAIILFDAKGEAA